MKMFLCMMSNRKFQLFIKDEVPVQTVHTNPSVTLGKISWRSLICLMPNLAASMDWTPPSPSIIPLQYSGCVFSVIPYMRPMLRSPGINNTLLDKPSTLNPLPSPSTEQITTNTINTYKYGIIVMLLVIYLCNKIYFSERFILKINKKRIYMTIYTRE